MGYHRAFPDAEIVGVDINPQPRYPFTFVQTDAVWLADGLAYYGSDFDFIHASPPCQRYSAMSNCRPGLADAYPDLVDATRQLLQATGVPYVIENVPGSPLVDPVELCGQMFGLELYRHRLFECSFPVATPPHPEHVIPASKAGHWRPGTIMSVAGHVSPIAKAREVMGIDWMNRAELGEAIPPAYTEHIGRSLARHLERQAAA
jgi:DNA (cytosine-5)-methyltransferase 1